MTSSSDPDTLAVDALPEVDETGQEVPGQEETAAPETSVETLVADLERVTIERDTYLNDLQRVSAEFANYRKQAIRRQDDLIDHAAAGLAEKLLPVLDACDAAIAAGSTDVSPVHNALVEILRREGMTQIVGAGEPFDPNQHDAVLHEDAEGEHVVDEVLRAGYSWHDRTLRAAMVRTRGTA